MRIASSGRNPSEKEQPSDLNEMVSIENKSFDPDHEPRKEGTIKMKHSPSIAEIMPDGLSEGNSYDRNKRGSQSRSPGRVVAHITDNDDDSNANYRSLNSDNKINRSSNRKIKPVGYQINNSKNILKVVHEDDHSNGSNAYLPKSNAMSIVTSPQY